MDRKYDLVAICLLMAAVVIATAMALDPEGFSIQKWQTLMAAIVALGAASLAYRSSMAKVELDREIDRRNSRRRQRGLYLKTRAAVSFMKKEAGNLSTFLMDPFEPRHTKIIDATDIRLSMTNEIQDAWLQLDAFNRSSAETIANLKAQLIIFHDEIARLPALAQGERVELPPSGLVAFSINGLREALRMIAIECIALEAELTRLLTEMEDS